MQYLALQEFYKVYDQLNEGEAILDVRTPDEFSDGHIQGAFNIDHREVTQYLEKLKGYKKIYVYCRRGARAQMAVHALEEEGLENLVCIADAGMEKWLELGHPVV